MTRPSRTRTNLSSSSQQNGNVSARSPPASADRDCRAPQRRVISRLRAREQLQELDRGEIGAGNDFIKSERHESRRAVVPDLEHRYISPDRSFPSRGVVPCIEYHYINPGRSFRINTYGEYFQYRAEPEMFPQGLPTRAQLRIGARGGGA